MQCLSEDPALQDVPQPRDLFWGSEERMIAKNCGVLSLDDILYLVNRLGNDFADPLDMSPNDGGDPPADASPSAAATSATTDRDDRRLSSELAETLMGSTPCARSACCACCGPP